MRGNFLDDINFSSFITDDWELLGKKQFLQYFVLIRFKYNFIVVKIGDPQNYHLTFWSGKINNTKLRLDSFRQGQHLNTIDLHSTMTFGSDWNMMYCCCNEETYQVTEFRYDEVTNNWQREKDLPRYETDETEMLLQMKYDKSNGMLLGTTGKGFALWDLNGKLTEDGAIYVTLPHGVRNITTKMMVSNSMMVSASCKYAVAGVR